MAALSPATGTFQSAVVIGSRVGGHLQVTSMDTWSVARGISRPSRASGFFSRAFWGEQQLPPGNRPMASHAVNYFQVWESSRLIQGAGDLGCKDSLRASMSLGQLGFSRGMAKSAGSKGGKKKSKKGDPDYGALALPSDCVRIVDKTGVIEKQKAHYKRKKDVKAKKKRDRIDRFEGRLDDGKERLDFLGKAGLRGDGWEQFDKGPWASGSEWYGGVLGNSERRYNKRPTVYIGHKGKVLGEAKKSSRDRSSRSSDGWGGGNSRDGNGWGGGNRRQENANGGEEEWAGARQGAKEKSSFVERRRRMMGGEGGREMESRGGSRFAEGQSSRGKWGNEREDFREGNRGGSRYNDVQSGRDRWQNGRDTTAWDNDVGRNQGGMRQGARGGGGREVERGWQREEPPRQEYREERGQGSGRGRQRGSRKEEEYDRVGDRGWREEAADVLKGLKPVQESSGLLDHRAAWDRELEHALWGDTASGASKWQKPTQRGALEEADAGAEKTWLGQKKAVQGGRSEASDWGDAEEVGTASWRRSANERADSDAVDPRAGREGWRNGGKRVAKVEAWEEGPEEGAQAFGQRSGAGRPLGWGAGLSEQNSHGSDARGEASLRAEGQFDDAEEASRGHALEDSDGRPQAKVRLAAGMGKTEGWAPEDGAGQQNGEGVEASRTVAALINDGSQERGVTGEDDARGNGGKAREGQSSLGLGFEEGSEEDGGRGGVLANKRSRGGETSWAFRNFAKGIEDETGVGSSKSQVDSSGFGLEVAGLGRGRIAGEEIQKRLQGSGRPNGAKKVSLGESVPSFATWDKRGGGRPLWQPSGSATGAAGAQAVRAAGRGRGGPPVRTPGGVGAREERGGYEGGAEGFQTWMQSRGASAAGSRGRGKGEMKQSPRQDNGNGGEEGDADSHGGSEDYEDEVSSTRNESVDGPSSSTLRWLRGEVVYGLSPVRAALVSGRRRFYTLYVQEGLEENLGPKGRRKDKAGVTWVLYEAEKAGIRIVHTGKHELNLLTAHRPHQGLVLDASPLKLAPLESLPGVNELGGAEEEDLGFSSGGDLPAIPPVWVALDEVVDPQNLGAILRSAYFLGAGGVVVCTKNSAPLSGVVGKASAGAMETMTVHSCRNMVRFLQRCTAAGWLVAGASADPEAVPVTQLPRGVPTVLVLGNEGAGLRTNVKRACTHMVRITGAGSHVWEEPEMGPGDGEAISDWEEKDEHAGRGALESQSKSGARQGLGDDGEEGMEAGGDVEGTLVAALAEKAPGGEKGEGVLKGGEGPEGEKLEADEAGVELWRSKADAEGAEVKRLTRGLPPLIDSLNVSVAAGILLHELLARAKEIPLMVQANPGSEKQRQMKQAGLLSLDEEEVRAMVEKMGRVASLGGTRESGGAAADNRGLIAEPRQDGDREDFDTTDVRLENHEGQALVEEPRVVNDHETSL